MHIWSMPRGEAFPSHHADNGESILARRQTQALANDAERPAISTHDVPLGGGA
jgi:hypothetical protein